jgi:hypothetical protein
MNRDPIDDLLDDPAPLPDDGFTRRVMAALPPPRAATRPLDRWLLPLGVGVVAAALAPDLNELSRGLASSMLRASQGAAQAFASTAGGGGLQGSLSLVAALSAAAAVIGSWLVSQRT